LDPQQRRQGTLEALILQLKALTRSHPALMILEDAHWSDPTTLEVFGRIVGRIQSLRVLLIVTFRPDFDLPWIGMPHVTAMTINRLTKREVGAMIEGVVGNKLLPANVRQAIIERSDGIPLFVEEMTKAVLEAESEGEARLTVAAVPSPALAVPPSLHASLLARLDRLGPAKEVAQIGAAIGREFSHALLAAVMRKPEVDLRSALDRLVAAGLLFRQGVPPHATYLFKHALVQDAAYGTLLREQRRALHVRIADTLENRFPEIAESQPEQLAQHCAEAGQINEAIEYWTKAGQTSLARSAMVEATRQVQKGLALLSGLVETSERQRKELALQTVLGVAQFCSKGEGALEVGEAFIRAHALCDQLGDRSNLGSVLYMQGSHSIARAQYAVALRLAEQQLNLATERNDSVLELQAHLSVGRCLHFRGAFASAIEHFERALSVSVPEKNDHDYYKVVAASYLAIDLLLLGYLDRAVACSDRAVALARTTSGPYTVAVALFWAAEVNWFRGAELAAVDCLKELAALARQHDFSLFVAAADLGLERILGSVEGLGRARQAVADCATVWGGGSK